MEIRLMRPDDYSAVYGLWLSCAGMGLNDSDDSREGIARFLARNPGTCFVAQERGEVLGVIMAGDDGRRGFIYHTAVSPLRRREGIGTQLVARALGALKRRGINKAALVVFTGNEAGNRFWAAQGFTPRDDLVYRNKALAELRRIDT